MADQAVQQLRRDVLTGTFAAGAKLKVEELQAAYGFSSGPLREAPSRVSQEGLVRDEERRGFRVAALSPHDLRDITRMRLMLDVPAPQEAIEHGHDAWEAAIVAAYYRLQKVDSCLLEGPVILDEEWGALHRNFHAALLAACPSQCQLAWSPSPFDQAERCRRLSARYRKTLRHKSNEHKKLVGVGIGDAGSRPHLNALGLKANADDAKVDRAAVPHVLHLPAVQADDVPLRTMGPRTRRAAGLRGPGIARWPLGDGRCPAGSTTRCRSG